MDETILFPSPNWFQASGLAVTRDNWLIYGGPTKSLCVLEPLPADQKKVVQGNQAHTAHVVYRAHIEKITCLDVSPEWPEKKAVLTGSQDGVVKQWLMERTERSLAIRPTHSHDIHSNEKEEVIGVGYCNDGYALTVGSHGNIVKWDLSSNVMKTYNKVLRGFKPTCIACSPHTNLNVAIGTKQGVIFVLDLNGAVRVVFKVRGQDDEISKVGWCPQYEVAVRKLLKESNTEPTVSSATKRMAKIRLEPEDPEVLKALDKRVQESVTEDIPVKINENLEPVTDENVSELNDTLVVENEPNEPGLENATALEPSKESELENESGLGKTLPEDSFDETVVQEDDMFDIYKDHEADEFGHKKYEPEDVLVRVSDKAKPVDYLTECLKLKEDILKRKNQSDQPINALVEALDKTHVDAQNEPVEGPSTSEEACDLSASTEALNVPKTSSASSVQLSAPLGKITKGEVESSVHIHKHLLATIGKHGSVRVWSKSGKLVGTCRVGSTNNKNQNNQRASGPNWCTLLWYQPEVLLLADGKSQLLECNPLKIDCKNKLDWTVVHSLHKRGLFSITSNCPRVQPPDMSADKSRDSWLVWTAAQDRNLICYSIKQRAVLSTHESCGGYIYTVRPCPYDARRIAVSVGDGAVRVWDTETAEDDDTKLMEGHVASYWQNVQGKVLTVAWHPTRENILAFGTAEARIGLIDTGRSRTEKAAKVLPSALSSGVYALSWGEKDYLYACGNGGELMRFNTAAKADIAPSSIAINHEGVKWSLTYVRWHAQGLICGSCNGGVALVNNEPPYEITAAVFVFSKMIHNVDWHPQDTTNSEGESPYKNLWAVCSLDKSHNIIILELTDKDGGKELTTWKTLSGHTQPVLQVAWNPHTDGQLMSTSQDTTVRVWSAESGACVAIFGGHSMLALGAAWSQHPQLSTTIFSGGGDCALRVWDYTDHPPELYQANPKRKPKFHCPKMVVEEGATEEDHMHEVTVKRDRKRTKKEAVTDVETSEEMEQKAAILDARTRASKRFILPLSQRQINPCKIEAVRYIFSLYCMQYGNSQPEMPDSLAGLDYIKMFGTTKELTELLDDEAERLLDTGCFEGWCMLNVVRGYMDIVYTYAQHKNLLDSYLLSMAPCVSFKYWKDMTQHYLAQIDRMVAKGQQVKMYEEKMYGGPIYRKVGAYLTLHDVYGAVKTLVEAQLFKEAYILCRTRYVEDLAKETLQQWAYFSDVNGIFNLSAICYIALGDIFKAANVLGKSLDEQSLHMAGTMAKMMGQTAFSQHCFEKSKAMEKAPQLESSDSSEMLEPLPSRAELHLNGQETMALNGSNDVNGEVNNAKIETVGGSNNVNEEVNAKTEEGANCVKGEENIAKVDTEDGSNRVNGEENVAKIETEISDDVVESKDGKTSTTEKNCFKTDITVDVADEDGENQVNSNGDAMKPENIENVKEASDKDNIEQILEELPSKIKGMTASEVKDGEILVASNGDTMTAENNESASNKDKIIKILEELPSKIEGMTIEIKNDHVKNQTVPINGSGDAKINSTQDVLQ